MKKQDYTVNITVNATAKEAFKSINSVTKWWTEYVEGSSQKLNDEFTEATTDYEYYDYIKLAYKEYKSGRKKGEMRKEGQ